MNSCYGGCLFICFYLDLEFRIYKFYIFPLEVTSVLIKNTFVPISSFNPKCGLEAELHVLYAYIHIYAGLLGKHKQYKTPL